MRSAFLISRIIVHDAERMKEYVSAADPLLKKFGGRHVMLSDEVEVLDGKYEGGRMVIMHFPDVDQFWDFWNSADYQELRVLRRSISTGDVWLVPENMATIKVD